MSEPTFGKPGTPHTREEKELENEFILSVLDRMKGVVSGQLTDKDEVKKVSALVEQLEGRPLQLVGKLSDEEKKEMKDLLDKYAKSPSLPMFYVQMVRLFELKYRYLLHSE